MILVALSLAGCDVTLSEIDQIYSKPEGTVDASTLEQVVAGAAQLRTGIETTLAFIPVPWLRFDAAITVARGHEQGARRELAHLIPLAPRVSGTAGIALHSSSRFASLRVRALGPRPTGDASLQARGSTVFDLVAGQRWRSFELGLTIENLLDASWREVQYASEVRPSRRVDIRRDMLVSTGAPLTAMVTLGYAPR